MLSDGHGLTCKYHVGVTTILAFAWRELYAKYVTHQSGVLLLGRDSEMCRAPALPRVRRWRIHSPHQPLSPLQSLTLMLSSLPLSSILAVSAVLVLAVISKLPPIPFTCNEHREIRPGSHASYFVITKLNLLFL